MAEVVSVFGLGVLIGDIFEDVYIMYSIGIFTESVCGKIVYCRKHLRECEVMC